MKELVIQIPPQKEALVKELIKELGGNVVQRKIPKKAKVKSNVVETNGNEEASPTFLFGKWKDIDIDANKLREEAWDRSHKFL